MAVKSVEIIGVEQQNLKDSILNSFRAKNLNVLQRMAGINSVFSWTDGNGDLRLMPQIKKAEVEVKSYQRKVVIEAKEREKEGVWCPNSPDGGECYWFDSEGVLFLRSSRPEGGLVRLVIGYHGQKPNFLTSFYPDGWSSPVRSVFGILEMSGMPSRTVYLTPPDREEIYVDLKGGPRLLFSTKFDPAHALPVLETLRMENKLNSLQYVDFRTENRAYYK